jgi:hypothetical protein
VGLGGGQSVWDDYEWVRLPDLPPQRTGSRAESLVALLDERGLWVDGEGTRILLVDLDNLRAEPVRWRTRMQAVVLLAREADHVELAGQVGAVERAAPHLSEFAVQARAVEVGSDLADYVLLDAAKAVLDEHVQVVVVSNDGIFADLADRGRLSVVSPGGDALSERLREAATIVVDLHDLEQAVAKPTAPANVR